MSSRTRSRSPTSIGSNQSSRRWVALSALRLQGRRVRAIAGHSVVSTGGQTPGLLGFQHPETTPPSIPTTPRTAPCSSQPPSVLLCLCRTYREHYSLALHPSERADVLYLPRRRPM